MTDTGFNRPRWRLRVMMAERDITTVTELRRRLETVGVDISSQQLNRVVNELPLRLSTDLLAGLVTVLECTPNDLLCFINPEGARAAMSETETEKLPHRRRAIHTQKVQASTDVLGPKIAPFPVPERGPKE